MATVAEAYLSVIRSEKNSDQKMANKQPKVYILDTSVAGLILDGELWSRESGLLVRYHTDLQATVTPRFKTDPRRLGRDVIYSTAGIIQTQDSTGTKLFVTPTVQNELSDTLQVCTCM